jgi:DNA polymerase-3 subunit beta
VDITISKVDLAKLMTKACAVVEDKPSKPIMACAILRAEGNALYVSAADSVITMAITSRATCEVVKSGTIAVNAKDLLARVQLHQAGPVRLVERAGKLEIIGVGTKRKHVLSTATVADYPTLPIQDTAIASISLVSRSVARMLVMVEYAVSLDVTRAHVNCVYIEFNGTHMHVAATDGSRASHIDAIVATNAPSILLIQQRAALQLRKVIEASRSDIESSNISIALSSSDMFFTIGDTCFIVKQLSAVFPYWRGVLEGSRCNQTIDIGRAKLIDMIRSADVAANGGSVKFDFTPTSLRVWTISEAGESSDDVDVSYMGKPFTTALDAKYAIDVLNALESDQVRIFVSDNGDPLDPVIIRPITDKTDENFDGVLMPCRI